MVSGWSQVGAPKHATASSKEEVKVLVDMRVRLVPSWCLVVGDAGANIRYQFGSKGAYSSTKRPILLLNEVESYDGPEKQVRGLWVGRHWSTISL